MKYYKRHWEENRGDDHADWGKATYYFEVDDLGQPTKQVEVYENDKVIKYSKEKPSDAFGMLADQFDPDEFKPYEIQKEEFEEIWTKS